MFLVGVPEPEGYRGSELRKGDEIKKNNKHQDLEPGLVFSGCLEAGKGLELIHQTAKDLNIEAQRGQECFDSSEAAICKY